MDNLKKAIDYSVIQGLAIPLIERIDSAIKRITSGQAPMRIPPSMTDPDLVLAAAKDEIMQLLDRLALMTKERDELKKALQDMSNGYAKLYKHAWGQSREVTDDITFKQAKQALERGEQEDTMSRYIAAITNNQLEIHAAAMDAPDGYDTLCGMDIDDPAIGHVPSKLPPKAKITCGACYNIFKAAHRFTEKDFAK